MIYGVVGANGFVGNAIVSFLKKMNYKYVPIYRNDDYDEKIRSVDYVIHCANSPSRFKAYNDPVSDYSESVLKTLFFYNLAKKYSKKFCLISSISARAQLNHIYGINRLSSENIVSGDSYIIRLGYMYSSDKTYGAISDILNNKDVFLDPLSSYSFCDVKWVAKTIIQILSNEKPSLFELGSNQATNLLYIKSFLSSQSSFVEGSIKDIQIANISTYFEESACFHNYLSTLKVSKND